MSILRAMGTKRQPAAKTVTVPLDAVALEFLETAGRDLYPDRVLSAEEVILDLIQSAIIESGEGGEVVDAETGQPVKFPSEAARDRASLEAVGLRMLTDMSAPEIKARRKELGLTQGQMAERLKVDVMTVSRWERGITKIRPREAFRIRTMKP